MNRAASLALVLALAASACSSSSSSSGDDAGAQDAAPDVYSTCGHPGDTGNSLGVGAYCNNIHDCDNTPYAHLCSVLGDSNTHFCTKTCPRPADAGAEAGATDSGADASSTSGDAGTNPLDLGCGEGASCQCDSAGCGCTPNACL